MRRRRRVGDEAFRIAEIVRDVDEPQRVEKAEAGLLVAVDVEGDDGAARGHLAPRQLVLRMARQAGIDHPRRSSGWVSRKRAIAAAVRHCRSTRSSSVSSPFSSSHALNGLSDGPVWR